MPFFYSLGSWPNVLTLMRISCVPIIILSYYLPVYGHKLAALLFALAAGTDWLDGYLARQLRQSSSFGAFLDPVADKLLVCVALLLVLGSGQQEWAILLKEEEYSSYGPIIATLPVIIIVCREVVVSALREWLARLGASERMAVSVWGKCKTVLQMIALTILLICDQYTSWLLWCFGYALLYAAALMSLWSMGLYWRAAFAVKS